MIDAKDRATVMPLRSEGWYIQLTLTVRLLFYAK